MDLSGGNLFVDEEPIDEILDLFWKLGHHFCDSTLAPLSARIESRSEEFHECCWVRVLIRHDRYRSMVVVSTTSRSYYHERSWF